MRTFLPLLVACTFAVTMPAAQADTPRSFDSQAGTLTLTTVAKGLENAWGLAFLPDGRMLVTERPGRMRIVDAQGRIGAPLQGLPQILVRGQGGLLDVALAPDFAQSQRIYFSYSQPRGDTNATAVARARLSGERLRDLEVVFRQEPGIDSGHHFGSRLVFTPDGQLFITLGDRNSARDMAQTLDNTVGKVVRITPDGAPSAGNPFLVRDGARPEIWSFGHRNIQGAVLHPRTGALWTHEHGPRGGDELNLTRPGRNYGWPVITHGREYSGLKVGKGIKEQAGMEQPQHYWVPSIAPSGMAFYEGPVTSWRGNLFIGSLKFGQLVRLQLDGERVTHEERLLEGLNQRIRDVRMGPDGHLYLLTDASDGAILRVNVQSP